MHHDDDYSTSEPHSSHRRPPGAPTPYADGILAERQAKDALFRHSARSPLPPDRRPYFTGLSYFRPDERFRLVGLRLEAAADGDRAPFLIETSDHRPRQAYRLGRLRFELGGRQLALTGYRVGGGTARSLFVPFRDLTSGTETYAAGRYLDIDVEPDGSYVLDFNLAYNPLCAYSDTYSCPLPPAENWLPVRIEAGERYAPGHDPT